jgi:hypothetical protein
VAALAGRLLPAALAPEHAAWHAAARDDAAATDPVAIVVPSIVQGQAISENALRLAAALLGDGQRVHFLITEEQTARTPPCGFLRYLDVPSSREGAPLLSRLVEMAAAASGRLTLSMLATRGTYLDAAREAIAHLRSLHPRTCLFFGNASCPITLAMAWGRVATRQVSLSMGVPLVVAGVDAIIFNNPRKCVRDGPALEAAARSAGQSLRCLSVETSGGDASGSRIITTRRELGVPEAACLLAQASNALAKRMCGTLNASTFAHDLARFMAAPGREDVWWIGIGPWDAASADAARVLGAIDSVSPALRNRMRFLGPRENVRADISAADLFLNEYPEGGGNSVIEAMGCAVPVVAMRAGERHAECIGADLVGDDAIPSASPRDYWALAARWCDDAPQRRAAGARHRTRALAQLDYAAVMRQYLGLLHDLDAAAAAGPIKTPTV